MLHPRHYFNKRGFTALIAVILLSVGSLTFSMAVLGAVVLYADSVRTHELRLQAALDAEACADSIGLMSAKNYFIYGTATIGEFGCTAYVTKNYLGQIVVMATSTLSTVRSTVNKPFFLIF